MPQAIKFCARTDTGLKRSKNEDCFLTLTGSSSDIPVNVLGSMFAVADGMGGHPAGDKAARMACDTFRDCYYGVKGIEKAACFILARLCLGMFSRLLLRRMEDAIKMADKAIQEYECQHKKCEGLGTTLSVLVLAGRTALIAHVGDSRIYRLRKGKLDLLTVDHTFVQDLVDMGEMTRKEADESPMRHVLMEALGRGVDEIFTRCEKVLADDLFLVCSDGLHDMINEETIHHALTSGSNIDEKCGLLIEQALDAGGKDNVTVVVVQAA
jgi:protein phosphatase